MDKERLKEILEEFVKETGETTELILIGGLAMQFYGVEDRTTLDVDAEVIKGNLFELYEFLKKHNIIADLSENIGGWSVIAMPEGYRERAYTVVEGKDFKIKLLDEYDFVVAKLRRGTIEDIEDAKKIFQLYRLSIDELDKRVDSAIRSSIKDTALFSFKKRYEKFKQLVSEK